jgi:nucleoid DNA-binding protein
MNKADLVDVVQDLVDRKLTRPECDDLVTAVFNKIVNGILSGDLVRMHNVGTFRAIPVRSKKGRDFRTNTPIETPPTIRVRFIPSLNLKRKFPKLYAALQKN